MYYETRLLLMLTKLLANDYESLIFSFGCADELGVGVGKTKRPD